jgi:hypothetical protein
MKLRALLIPALVAAGLTAGQAATMQAQQSQAGQLIATARANMNSLLFDAAVTLLKQALDSAAGATSTERVRALVLLCAADLNLNQPDAARAAAAAALAIEPQERVDSLDEFSGDLVPLFRELRPPAPATLEIRGLPVGAELKVDGVVWTKRSDEVSAGTHVLEVSARGYVSMRDSVVVDPSLPTVRTLSLTPAAPAQLSVSSVPWGIVYVDSVPVGETPVFDYMLPSGAYAVSVRNAAGSVLHQQRVQLQPGRPTNLGTLGTPPRPAGRSSVFGQPDALFYALQLDSALKAYRALAADTVALPSPELRARAATRVGVIYYAMAAGRKNPSDRDSARAAFELAYRLAAAVQPDPAETGNDLLAFVDSVRAVVLVLSVSVRADTVVPLHGGHIGVAISTSHGANAVVTVTRTDSGAAPVYTRTLVTSPEGATTDWDLRSPDGGVVPDGHYRLRVTASDAAGQGAPADVRLLTIAWERPDTAPLPPPLAASAFAPETRELNSGPASALLVGALIGAATLALPSVAGNSTLNKGLGTDGGAYIAAGASVLAGVIAFLAGHRVVPLPENVAANQRMRAQDEARRTAIVQNNARARENIRAHVRVEAAP